MSSDSSPIEIFEIEQPRSFGYLLGDKFERRVELQLRAPYQLLAETLPEYRRLNRWVALDDIVVTESHRGASRHYDIRFVYLVINTDEAFSDVGVPAHEFSIGDGDETLSVFIRPARTRVSRFSDDTAGEPRPDHVPKPQSISNRKVIFYAGILIASLLGLAILHWGLPDTSGKRPFTALSRRLRRSRSAPMEEAQYHDALQLIHAAFNHTAGKTVFVETLDDFFAECERFQPHDNLIREFFDHSRQYFYDTDATADRYSATELLGLVQSCSDAERGLK